MNKENNINQLPLSVSLMTVKKKIETALNESGLHICILDMVVSELASEIHNLANKQSIFEIQEYEKQNKENNVEGA